MKNADYNVQLSELIKQSLAEDAPTGDITTQTCIPHTTTTEASLIAKQHGLFFGANIITAFVRHIDSTGDITWNTQDASPVTPNTPICSIKTKQDSILLIERSMLNIVQKLSGIATLTQEYIQALNNPDISICDTRKTTPRLRFLEKEAVVAGGGSNHRHSLSDMILIKENHLSSMKKNNQLPNLHTIILNAKEKNPKLKAEIEIESIDQLTSLPLSSFDYIMLDNFTHSQLPEAIAYCRKTYPKTKIELSGNITLSTIKSYSNYDIDRISVGSLTHSVPAFDLSLLIR